MTIRPVDDPRKAHIRRILDEAALEKSYQDILVLFARHEKILEAGLGDSAEKIAFKCAAIEIYGITKYARKIAYSAIDREDTLSLPTISELTEDQQLGASLLLKLIQTTLALVGPPTEEEIYSDHKKFSFSRKQFLIAYAAIVIALIGSGIVFENAAVGLIGLLGMLPLFGILIGMFQMEVERPEPSDGNRIDELMRKATASNM